MRRDRWYIAPVVVRDEPGWRVRGPKLAWIPEPGRTKTVDGEVVAVCYDFVVSQHVDEDWMLCRVKAHNFSALDADPEIIRLFEDDTVNLKRSPAELKWTDAQYDRFIAILKLHDTPINDFGKYTPLWVMVQRLGRVLHEDFEPRHAWIHV